MKSRFLSLQLILCLILVVVLKAQAQERQVPEWRKMRYLSEEEMKMPVTNRGFEETAPPVGEVRFPAEYEPMQAVMIVHPLGIPMELVREMAKDCKVITVTLDVESAKAEFEYGGVNMDNCEFLYAKTDSYWIRDFGPWYIFEDKEPAIVDNKYNRPRPNDDVLPGHFAQYWNIPMYGMNVVHTGGNMMQDGFGVGVSDDIVITESVKNGITEEEVYQRMKEYLGIDPYHVTIDPQGDYIAHVDCWGKFLAPDKILLAKVPESHPRYPYYEEIAEYFETTNCSWGYPYKVYRVNLPGGNAISPYTNSLILNDKVLVPMGSNSEYNEAALQVYRDAMPGYNIVGISDANDWSWDGWLNTDALHCRTRGVMDFDMLYIDHRNVLFGERDFADSLAVVSEIIAYSGAELKQDSLLVYYSIDGGEYQTAKMTATGVDDEYIAYIKGFEVGSKVDYYVYAADESGRNRQQPVFGETEPHTFIVTEALDITTPENLAAEATSTSEITLTWNAVENALSYDVYKGDEKIANVEETTYDVTGLDYNTEYCFTVTAKRYDNETEKSEESCTKTLGESIAENANCFDVYPNPVENQLFITTELNVEEVGVYNITGVLVRQKTTVNGQQSLSIDVAELNSGIYFVKVITENGETVKRFIKK